MRLRALPPPKALLWATRVSALISALMLMLALAPTPAWAQGVLPVPPLSGRIVDQTATLQPAQKAALEAKLAAFEAQAGPQIVVLMVPATAPEDIAAYAQRVADQWKIGRRQVGDGVLLVVAKDERAVRIEVAKALEGAIPDLAARQVIDQALVPAFRTGDYAGGLNLAIDRLVARIQGEGLPAPAPRGPAGKTGGALPLEQLGFMLFIGVMVVGGLLGALLGRGPGSVLTAVAAGGAAWWLGAGVLLAGLAALLAVVVVGVVGVGNVLQLVLMARGGGGFGGGGHGGGGGGFSSGGGGDFGGGGASGRW